MGCTRTKQQTLSGELEKDVASFLEKKSKRSSNLGVGQKEQTVKQDH